MKRKREVMALKIFVDHRERQLSGLLEEVLEDFMFTQLPIGDYMLVFDSEAVIIERKTVADFVSSIRSNRLWDQLLRMMTIEKIGKYHIKRKMLLIHGNFKDYLNSFYFGSKRDILTHWAQLMGASLEIIYVYNTPIIHAESDNAFKAFLKTLMMRETLGKNDKHPEAKWYHKPVKADLPVKDRKKYILSSLPYIGERLAENLLFHFNTIANIACASEEDLQKVPKIGKKKANLIYQIFHT